MDEVRFLQNIEQKFDNSRIDFQTAHNTVKKVAQSKVKSAQRILDLHRNTYFRMVKSFFHLERLTELKSYQPKTFQLIELIIIHYENLLFSLSGALDSLANEIDEVFQLRFGKHISIATIIDRPPPGPLANFLLKEIQPGRRDSWFSKFREERNICVHRLTKFLKATWEKRPNLDTKEIEEELVAGKTRVFENSRDYYEKVESLIINVYRYMTGKITGKKILVEKDIKGEVLSKLECPFCGVLVAWTEKRRPRCGN